MLMLPSLQMLAHMSERVASDAAEATVFGAAQSQNQESHGSPIVCHKSKTAYNAQPQVLSQVISSTDSNSTQPQMLSKVINRADSNVHPHEGDTMRQRIQQCGRHDEVADPIRIENLPLPDPHTGSLRQEYICGYCDRRKPSIVRCVDGRVRLRCKCGGPQADGKLRLHSAWSMEGSRKNFFLIMC